MKSDTSSPAPSDWRQRRQAARETCAAVASNPENGDMLAMLRDFALDPKWEVRKVVAESLIMFPEDVAKDMSTLMAGETHHMVEAAIRRSLSGRQIGSTPTKGHEGLLQDEYDKIRSRYGQEAADAAKEMAEKSTSLHLRAAVHDIRNIITALNPSRELAADPKYSRNVKRIIKGRSYLKRMLDMMDKYSAPLVVQKTSVPLREVIEESLSSALSMIKDEGCDPSKVAINAVPLEDLKIFAARFELVMALTNLIKNAIEAHGRKGERINQGQVNIYFGFLERIPDVETFLEIYIQDSGVGLSQTDLDDRMKFIPGNTSKEGGTGYGLPLCNRYIAAHGGYLSLRSRDGEGTTAIVTIPFCLKLNSVNDENIIPI